jgi:pimeloyl-[acyl-carrier protein] synthase
MAEDANDQIPIASLVMRLYTPEGRADPYPIYRQIQSRAPVWFFGGSCSLSTHRGASLVRDPRFVVRDPSRASSPSDQSPWHTVSNDFLLFVDPPDHTRIRSLVTSAFTPRAVEALRTRVGAIVDELLDAVDGDSFDLIADFAYPLPVRVICELLGLPDQHRDAFKAWSRAIAPAFDNQTVEVMTVANAAVDDMRECLTAIVADRRRSPGDDLLTALIAAEERDRKLNANELIANLILLFFGGHETTVNLIANGMLAMLRNRGQWDRLKAEPSLARNAVEEALRYDSPVQATSRTPTVDIDVDGQTIPAGERVNFILGAANRDPAAFARADEFDISRPDAARHLAFGGGMHYCVGAPLARLEGELAFTALAARLPTLRLETEQPEWREMFILRGMKSLPVSA